MQPCYLRLAQLQDQGKVALALGVASAGVAVRLVHSIVAAVPPGTWDAKETVMLDRGVLWKLTVSPT
jgi:hypothetical protein